MACEMYRATQAQTLTERKKQIVETIEELARQIARGNVKVLVGPQGAIAFPGWNNNNGVTDACAYRTLMARGGTETKRAIMKAEMLAGRKVDSQVIASGVHAHGGVWHGGHK